MIDQLCDEYENLARNGSLPNLREYLEKAPQESRVELLRELLALESELLPAAQWQRRLLKHRQDLPEYGEVIESIVDANRFTTIQRPKDALEQRSRRIGPYKILQMLGEGGMGSVYMAQQENPVRRRVALKIIKAGMDHKQVIARFEAERQALAMMDHPSIARILDAGKTEDGQPYFAMELVKGIDLNKYCNRHKLSISRRLEIFSQICEAVQHAHQKGIIHRDLKPSNILVAEFNGKPVPKIIDFGLAKALEVTNRLTEKTMFTEFGQALGTLKYMSPEQAGLDSLDIDTRSDIYTLGVILYELLTGTTPLDSDSFRNQAFAKILEMVREYEAPRPSRKLTTEAESLSTVTEQRRIEPRKLTQVLTGDLDWIVMKAIEKDRNRRYSTAAAFAEDIDNFLQHEPVNARPPSTAYRIKKFVNKHKGLVTTMSAITVLLIGGIIGTSTGFYQAEVAKGQAIKQQRIAENKAEQALNAEKEAKRQKIKADANFEKAWNAVTQLSKIADDPRLKSGQLEPLRREILAEAQQFYSSLVDSPPEKGLSWNEQDLYLSALIELARLHRELGQFQDAMSTSMNASDYVNESTYRNSIPAILRLLEISRGLAETKESLKNPEEAIEELRSQQVYWDELAELNAPPQRINFERSTSDTLLCRVLYNDGSYSEALARLNKSSKRLEQLREVPVEIDETRIEFSYAFTLQMKAVLLRLQKMPNESLAASKLALQVNKRLLARFPENFQLQFTYLELLRQTAGTQHILGKHEATIQSLETAIPIADELCQRFPSVIRYKSTNARLRNQLTREYLNYPKKWDDYLPAADENLEQVRELMTEISEVGGSGPVIEIVNMNFRIDFGALRLFQGRYDEAIKWLDEANSLIDKALARDQMNFDVISNRLTCLSARGRALAGAGRIDEAVADGEVLANLGLGHFGDAVTFDAAMIIGIAALSVDDDESKRRQALVARCIELLTGLEESNYVEEKLPNLDVESLRDPRQFKSLIEMQRHQIIE